MNKFTRNVKQAFGILASVTAFSLGMSERADAQVLINENFSTGTGFTAPSGWTNVSNNSADPWSFDDDCERLGFDIDPGSTAMSGVMAILDSDCTEDNHDADLTTPVFDASIAGTYMLDFDNSIYNYFVQLCEVQVWNGSVWTTVFSVNGADDGAEVANHKSINITSAVGTSSSAQVRFHYEGDYEWWWAIDNVTITRLNCTPPAATYAMVPDCANGQFSISVNLTSLGSATSVAIKEGSTVFATATAPGTYTAGPFTAGTGHTITLEHNADTLCNVLFPDLVFYCPASCVVGITPANGATNVVTNPYPTFSWQADPNATGYKFYIGETLGSVSEIADVTTTSLTVSGFSYATTYYWYVIPYNPDGDATGCDVNAFSLTTEAQPAPPANDDATGAIALTTGAPCTGAIYTTVSATSNTAASEPYANCHSNSTGDHSVWFSFVAPASGAVKITTDNGTVGTLTDTKIGLFAVTDASNYSTFTLLACDEDNGIDNDTTDLLSTIFATGLTSGTTYYIEVDAFGSGQEGTFCLQVEEINPTMLSNTASCADIISPYGSETTYTGWVTMLDADGKLVALARNSAGGAAGSYYGSYNIDGNGFGTPRQDANGVYYLSRNFNINNDDVTSPVELQFFFHPGEIATLSGVTGNATTIANLNVTHQAGSTCNANFSEGNGATSVLLQTANGTVNGVGWIQVETPGFSNFYLMGGTTPLYIALKDISAINEGNRNKVSWSTAGEDRGDYFELERSADGMNFSFLAGINAKGTAADYTYYDQAPLNGVNYYRLKLVHKEGKPAYSKVVTAMVSKSVFGVKAVPNPVSHMLKVMIDGGSTDAVVILSDVTGKALQTYKVTGPEVNIDMRAMAQGIYFVKYSDGSHVQTIKVNKQ